jgi:hypothetical protein
MPPERAGVGKGGSGRDLRRAIVGGGPRPAPRGPPARPLCAWAVPGASNCPTHRCPPPTARPAGRRRRAPRARRAPGGAVQGGGAQEDPDDGWVSSAGREHMEGGCASGRPRGAAPRRRGVRAARRGGAPRCAARRRARRPPRVCSGLAGRASGAEAPSRRRVPRSTGSGLPQCLPPPPPPPAPQKGGTRFIGLYLARQLVEEVGIWRLGCRGQRGQGWGGRPAPGLWCRRHELSAAPARLRDAAQPPTPAPPHPTPPRNPPGPRGHPVHARQEGDHLADRRRHRRGLRQVQGRGEAHPGRPPGRGRRGGQAQGQRLPGGGGAGPGVWARAWRRRGAWGAVEPSSWGRGRGRSPPQRPGAPADAAAGPPAHGPSSPLPPPPPPTPAAGRVRHQRPRGGGGAAAAGRAEAQPGAVHLLQQRG